MWDTIVLAPIYNILVALSSLFGGSLGWAVIGLTLLIKLVLLPFSWKTHISQILQKKLQPKIAEIKKNFPDQAEQSMKIMALYKESGSNPFAGCLPMLIQIPILIGMYQVFFKGISGGQHLLYSNINLPEQISTLFLGIDLVHISIPLAIAAGVFQAAQLMLSPTMKHSDPTDPAARMSRTMIYVIPIMLVVAGVTLPASLSLYFIANAVVSMIQEYAFVKITPKIQTD